MRSDLVVIGGGATGLGAAFEARRRGASVTLVERGRLGGDCTWTGCVPSKALLERAAEVAAARRRGFTEPVDGARVLTEVRGAIAEVARDESEQLLARIGITVCTGDAVLEKAGHVTVDGQTVTAQKVVIATGSQPVVPPALLDAKPITSDDVFELQRPPGSLAVVGGGPVGVEPGQAFARLGTTVTLVQASDRLLPREEPETSQAILDALVADGVDVRLATTVASSDSDRVSLDDGSSLHVDRVLAAAGRQPVSESLGLANAGVATAPDGAVVVDERLRTSVNGVFAAGDVTGAPFLTHLGYEEGRVAAANALTRRPRRPDTSVLPWAVFTAPEVGRVGMTEAQAHAAHGASARVAYVPMRRSDRARAVGHMNGFVKLVAGRRFPLGHLGGGRLLGATVVCPTGGDVVHEAAVLMRSGALTGRLAQTVHAYPSWSLAVRQAAAQFFRAEAGGTARLARPG